MHIDSEAELANLLQDDPIYQRLLWACTLAEPAYIKILNTLPQEDRRALEHYISLCEEMDHRILSLVLDKRHS